MIDMTRPDALDAQRIFRDRSRYQSLELEHVLGPSRVSAAEGDRACPVVRSEPQVDDDSIVRGLD
jgi:hypothetical protein